MTKFLCRNDLRPFDGTTGTSLRSRSLDLIKRHFDVAAVVQAGGAGRFVAGQLPGDSTRPPFLR